MGAEIIALSADTLEQAGLTVSELGNHVSHPLGLVAYTHSSFRRTPPAGGNRSAVVVRS